MAEDRQASHARSLLNHLRHAAKQAPGGRERHDLSTGETKKRRPLLLAALLAPIMIAVGLHITGGMLLVNTGLGGLSLHNPIALALIGLSLVVAAIKLKHAVGLIQMMAPKERANRYAISGRLPTSFHGTLRARKRRDSRLLKEVSMNKSALLDGVREEYRQWEVLLDQIGEARMDQPGAAADWSIKDIVAHLTGWRRRTVARLQAAQRGAGEPPPVPWPAHLDADEDLDAINAWIYEQNHGRPVREVLDDSHHVFQQMFAAIEGLPDQALSDPAHYLPWLEADSVKPSDFFGHFHEEHEQDMRAWLARGEKH